MKKENRTMDPEMQELFDAAKNYVDRIKESKASLPDYPVCLARLQTAVGALENKSTAQILSRVQEAMTDLRLVDYLLKGTTDVKTIYKALSEAIQVWHDAN